MFQTEKKDDSRKSSREKGPAPLPPLLLGQPSTSNASVSVPPNEKGPAPLPPVPLPLLPTPPSSPLTPPTTPPQLRQAENVENIPPSKPLSNKEQTLQESDVKQKVTHEVPNSNLKSERTVTEKENELVTVKKGHGERELMDVAFSKILSENKSLDALDTSREVKNHPEPAVGDSITITSPSVSPVPGSNLVVVSTSQGDSRHNTSTIIISDMPDLSNSLASNISQVIFTLSVYM